MPRLGCLVLASALLGVPRALQARTFGAPPRAVWVEVCRPSPVMGAFADAVGDVLAASAWSPASGRSQATTVVDVVGVVSSTDRRGRPVEAYALSVREGRRERRVVLHGRPEDRAGTARALVAALGSAPACQGRYGSCASRATWAAGSAGPS
ncbi:MAG TPA: hypothetical protein VMX54_01625 [Vicinamibacteria bacterium]|nr:hypothetical protein [Vicinamibacteria bacterium]